MNTTLWGPSGWTFLHTLTFIYPDKPSYNDKVKMQNFMKSINSILPCKYCRISFTKYTQNLPIDNYLDSRDSLIEWLYKIHNKVNKKLRIQGFCKYDNPDINIVKDKYSSIIEHINILCKSKRNKNENIQDIITYICNLGRDFLGSVIFNYQGYFSNCHSGDEKVKIVYVYNSFFNSIIPLISSYIVKICNDSNDKIYNDSGNYKLFKIRNILSQNEAYTKLIKWFYNCNILCSFDDKFKSLEEYINYYSKNIVLSCNTPVDIKGEIIKSCRKTTKSVKKSKKRI
jgi:hypothetical protein